MENHKHNHDTRSLEHKEKVKDNPPWKLSHLDKIIGLKATKFHLLP